MEDKELLKILNNEKIMEKAFKENVFNGDYDSWAAHSDSFKKEGWDGAIKFIKKCLNYDLEK